MRIIFDIIEHGGLFENAVQKVFGYTLRYKSVGTGWRYGGIRRRSSTAKKMQLELQGVS